MLAKFSQEEPLLAKDISAASKFALGEAVLRRQAGFEILDQLEAAEMPVPDLNNFRNRLKTDTVLINDMHDVAREYFQRAERAIHVGGCTVREWQLANAIARLASAHIVAGVPERHPNDLELAVEEAQASLGLVYDSVSTKTNFALASVLSRVTSNS